MTMSGAVYVEIEQSHECVIDRITLTVEHANRWNELHHLIRNHKIIDPPGPGT